MKSFGNSKTTIIGAEETWIIDAHEKVVRKGSNLAEVPLLYC